MKTIIIKDLEEIEMLKQDIFDLEKRIQGLKEVKELKKLKQEISILSSRIDNNSTYESNVISSIIAKLMTQFEGMKYYWKRDDFWTSNCNIYISPFNNREDIMYNYPIYKIWDIKDSPYSNDDENKVAKCYLPPTGFGNKPNAYYTYHSGCKREPIYIQLFLDFLYNKRSANSLCNIREQQLDEYFNEFIENTKDLQEERKKEIEEEIQKTFEERKRKEFEKSCVIDRVLMFDALSYIINHYELGMAATKEIIIDRYYGSQWDDNTAYHDLIVKSEERQESFRAIIDEDGCYPDEAPNLDTYKKTNICFFDIKRELWPVIKHTEYAILFMNMLEDLYNKGVIITRDRVQELLIVLSNERKKKQKALCFALKN